MRKSCAIALAITLCLSTHAWAGAKPKCQDANPWSGVYPTVLTPFCHDSVDVLALEKQLRYQLDQGVRGFVVLGTMGEGQYVNYGERQQVIATAVRVAGSCPVIAGIHTCDVDVARTQLLQAKELGASAVLVKYVGRPKAAAGEVFAFYAALSDLNALPIIYYHYPLRTGLALSARAIADIVALPGIMGIKESILDLGEVQAHMAETRGQGKVYFTATALNLTQFLDLGGHGAMCPEAALLPGPTHMAYQAWREGRPEEARAIQRDLFILMPILHPSLIPTSLIRAYEMTAMDLKRPVPMTDDHPQARLKAALDGLGVPMSATVKPPLPGLSKRDAHAVRSAVRRIQAIDWTEHGMKGLAGPGKTDCAMPFERGMLLRTGAFLLGPGVNKDLLFSQGDGKSGF